jgi:hypothetical protein
MKPSASAYHVFVDAELRPKHLMLAPISTSLSWVERKPTRNELVVASLTHPLTSQIFDLIVPVVFMKPVKESTIEINKLSAKSAKPMEGFTSFFNMVFHSYTEGHDNVHLEKEKIVIKVSVCGSADEHTAIIPYLTNRRILKKGRSYKFMAMRLRIMIHLARSEP